MTGTRERFDERLRQLIGVAARRAGLSVVRDDFNSPIVDPARLDPTVWSRPAPMPGLELDLDAQLELLERRLAPLLAHWHPPIAGPPSDGGLYLENPMYGPMDAHICYALLRDRPPRRVLELGSGYSTLVISAALAANAADRRPAEHVVIDPALSPLLERTAAPVQARAESAAATPRELFDALGAGDVLFVDTSHSVRPGGEVVRLVLEVLPSLADGVLVHFHDIYCPFPYPRAFYELFNVHWQEQYLVQALLCENPNFEVLCANHALWRQRRERVAPLFAGLKPGREPSGFWFQRRAASSEPSSRSIAS